MSTLDFGLFSPKKKKKIVQNSKEKLHLETYGSLYLLELYITLFSKALTLTCVLCIYILSSLQSCTLVIPISQLQIHNSYIESYVIIIISQQHPHFPSCFVTNLIIRKIIMRNYFSFAIEIY